MDDNFHQCLEKINQWDDDFHQGLEKINQWDNDFHQGLEKINQSDDDVHQGAIENLNTVRSYPWTRDRLLGTL